MQDLAKSQLFTLKGELIDDTLRVGKDSLSQKQASRQLDNVIIDQKYKIICLLGEGGMGAVYKAHHLMLNKDVALKTFRSPNLSDETWKRFQREAQAIGRLNHINIVQVFDYGVAEDNVPYYTMECLTGESLADRLQAKGRLALAQTIRLFLQVCQGMAVAHSKGIVHRDLKPANIFLANEASAAGKVDLVKIVDFGIACLATGSAHDQKLTTAGMIFGSPLYMSPEQSLGNSVTERSDIYSCGCSLFETLTGGPPYLGANAFATMLKHQQSPVPALNDPGQGEQFPQKLKVLIAKMLAKEEEERFQSFKEVSDLLEEILNAHNSNLSARSQGSSPIQSSDHQAQKHKQKHDGEQDQKQNQDPEQEQEQEDDDDNEAEAQGLPFGWPKAFVASIICLILILAGALLYFWPQPTAKVASLSTLQLSKSPPRDSEVARYLTNPNASKLEWRHFLFPKDEPIGTLHWIVNGIRSPKNVSAMGAVNVPPQSQLELTADETLSKQPELFYGFGANDLTAITLKREFSWNDKHIACIGRLTGLRSLTIGDVEFTDKCIDDFNKLNQLEALELDSTNLSDATLAKLKVLRRLRHLSVPGISPISTTLKLLKDSDRINMLGIERCHPTENDLKIVATMSNLNHLFLNNNPGITDKDLAYIGSLRKLDSLSIDGTGVSPGCIKTLKKLPLLDKLSIDSGVLTSADKAQLNEFKVCAVREFPPSEDRGASPFIKPGIEEIGHSNSFFKSAKHQ